MPNCAINGCKSTSSNAKERKLKLFSFPKDINVRMKWIKACKKNYKFNDKNARICSKHFTEDAFEKPLIQQMLNYSPINSRKLKSTAVPTQYLPPFAEVEIRIETLCSVIDNIPMEESGNSMITPKKEPSNDDQTQTEKLARLTYENLLSTYEKYHNENEELRSKFKVLKTDFDNQRKLYEKRIAENMKLRHKNKHLMVENNKLREQLRKMQNLGALNVACKTEDDDDLIESVEDVTEYYVDEVSPE